MYCDRLNDLKRLMRGIKFSDEDILNYIKNSYYLQSIEDDMRESFAKKYLEELEKENEEKVKKDFLIFIEKKFNKN